MASILYVFGGAAMTRSRGFEHFWPSLLVFVFFGFAAALQTIGMKAQELGVAYVLVLGLEAILAGAAGVIWLKEPLTWPKLAGTVLVVAGIVLLKLQELLK